MIDPRRTIPSLAMCRQIPDNACRARSARKLAKIDFAFNRQLLRFALPIAWPAHFCQRNGNRRRHGTWPLRATLPSLDARLRGGQGRNREARAWPATLGGGGGRWEREGWSATVLQRAVVVVCVRPSSRRACPCHCHCISCGRGMDELGVAADQRAVRSAGRQRQPGHECNPYPHRGPGGRRRACNRGASASAPRAT